MTILRLWFELDESLECGHVEYAWIIPDVKEMYANNVLKGKIRE